MQQVNYYRLSAYGLTLKDSVSKNQYVNGASFKKMLALYEFDRRLRLLLLGVLETIEIALRTHISYDIDFYHIGFTSNWKELLTNVNSHNY